MNNQPRNNLPAQGSLSQIFASLNLIGANIEARICMICNWDDDDFEYFCRHTDEISEEQKVLINNIISSELAKKFVSPPAIPIEAAASYSTPAGILVKRASLHRIISIPILIK